MMIMYDRQNYLKHDSPIKKTLLKLFKKNEKILILDIGACEGEESIKYKKIFPRSSIYLFEPLPMNQILIMENIEKYELKNVYLESTALSDHDGYTQFYISSGQPNNIESNLDWDFGNKSSSLLVPEHNNLPTWLNFDTIIKVQTITLDFFFKKNKIDTIDFIHMDVQGAELKVLEGAKNKIETIKAIWLEVSNVQLYKEQPLRTDVELFMQNKGFKLIKSEFSGEFGDQFYLNKRYFKIISLLKGKFQYYLKRK